mmetsp:Transcript_67444/g.119582  ORF Transcript_67444/g.119582 Transcript_67444/m.119582 type:complete len:328 (-) Transcript_67444:2117-3100(-)
MVRLPLLQSVDDLRLAWGRHAREDPDQLHVVPESVVQRARCLHGRLSHQQLVPSAQLLHVRRVEGLGLAVCPHRLDPPDLPGLLRQEHCGKVRGADAHLFGHVERREGGIPREHGHQVVRAHEGRDDCLGVGPGLARKGNEAIELQVTLDPVAGGRLAAAGRAPLRREGQHPHALLRHGPVGGVEPCGGRARPQKREQGLRGPLNEALVPTSATGVLHVTHHAHALQLRAEVVAVEDAGGDGVACSAGLGLLQRSVQRLHLPHGLLLLRPRNHNEDLLIQRVDGHLFGLPVAVERGLGLGVVAPLDPAQGRHLNGITHNGPTLHGHQ